MRTMPETTQSEAMSSVPTQRLQATIDIYEHDIIVSCIDNDGAVDRRMMGIEQLVRLLNGQRRKQREQTQLLGAGNGVVAIGFRDDEWRWLVRRPAKQTTLRVERLRRGRGRREAVRYEVAFRCPPLLAEMTGKPTQTGIRWQRVLHVHAVPSGPLRPETTLYACPTPDVLHGHAHMCNVNMAAVEGLGPLAAFEKAFFESWFTGYTDREVLTDQARARYRDVTNYLRKRSSVRLADLREEGRLDARYSICG